MRERERERRERERGRGGLRGNVNIYGFVEGDQETTWLSEV